MRPPARTAAVVAVLGIVGWLGCNAIGGIQDGVLVPSDATTGEAATGESGPGDAPHADATPGDATQGDAGKNDATTGDAGDAGGNPPDANAEASETDADAAGGNDAGPCVPGGACVPSACQTGLVVCSDAGVSQCGMATPVTNGTTCDAGAVCSAGACSACASGADCTDAGSCVKMTVDCSSGTAVCSAAGNEPPGTPCGANLYCNGGTCAACTNGAGCVPTGKPCDVGTVTCSAGQIVCNDMGTASNGTSCGTNEVCSGGQCVACTAGVSCTPPGNPCDIGSTSCATGSSVCMDTGVANTAVNGTSCGTNRVCGNGVCNACTAGVSCTVVAPGNVCDNGTYACGTGTPVCTDTGTANAALNGTTCSAGKVCDNGACNPCVTGAACTPTNPCHTGTTACTSGAPVCNDTGSNATDGTSCGAPLACYQGVCQCNFAGLAAYYPFNGDTLDHSGNGNNAVGSNTSFVTGGTFGKAIDMFQTDSNITISGSTVLSGPRTVCTWLATTNLTNGTGLPVVAFGSLGASDFLAFQPATSPSACAGVPALGLFVQHTGGACGPTSTVAINTSGGQNNFVCYDYDGATMTFYADAKTATFPTSLYNWPMSNVTIGSNLTGSTGVVRTVMTGDIDETSFWSRALTLAEMNALYNAGNGCKVH